MDERPDIDKRMGSAEFRNYYYLKEELVRFCRQEGLQTGGGKCDLSERIAHYMDTGVKLASKGKTRSAARTDNLTEDTMIGNNFVCSESCRAFFRERIGEWFKFNVQFLYWLRSNAEKSYGDAINEYHRIADERKRSKPPIGKQFEYNTYVRDFFADNKEKSLRDAITCWRYKKSISGHNRYERSDLEALYRP